MTAEYEYSRISTNKPIKQRIINRNAVGITLVLLFSVITAVLLVCGIMLRIELARQNDINLSLLAQINELNEENTRLRIEYESGIDLGELEEKAVFKLGMIKPQAYQIVKTEYEAQPTEAEPEKDDKDIELRDLISIISDLFL